VKILSQDLLAETDVRYETPKTGDQRFTQVSLEHMSDPFSAVLRVSQIDEDRE